MMHRALPAMAFILFFLPACRSSDSSESKQGPRLSRLRVDATDLDIRYQPAAEHLYWDCGLDCDESDKLFVFFPGSDGSPDSFQKILQVIGATGIRALALAYQNQGSLNEVCGTTDSCYTEARRDRVLGSAASPYVESVADGIQNRLLKALQALGWSQFYEGDTLIHSRLIFSGFSQGAGMAAWAAKKVSVHRVCLFAGPWDHLQGTTAASWLQESSATPVDRYFGFTHFDDSLPGGVQYLNLNWQILGMGNHTDIPLYTAPSGQKITATDSDTACAANPHACSVSDEATPLAADGSARYAAAWRYVCGR